MNYTSVEQSQRLLELGLRPETSDMIYSMVNGSSTPFIRLEKIDELDELHDLVCWSVGALINTMPKIITVNNQECYLHIYYTVLGSMAVEYSTFEENTLQYFDDKDLLEAIYYMICWLLENNYIVKESKTIKEE